MTTLSLTANVSRTGYHRAFTLSGSTWPAGKTALDVDACHFLFNANGTLIASNYTGIPFSYLHGDDDAGNYRYRARVSDSDGTHTAENDYTHTPPTYAHNIYVDPAAADDTAAGTIGDPYKTAAAGAAALRALGVGAANRRLLLHRTGTHALTAALVSNNTQGLFAVHAYGGTPGAQATVTLTGNVSMLSGIGPYSAVAQYTVDVRDMDITVSGQTNVAVFDSFIDGAHATAVSHSMSFKNISIDGCHQAFLQSAWHSVQLDTIGHDDAAVTAGRADHVAFEEFHVSNSASYGMFSNVMRYLHHKDVSHTTATAGGQGTAWRIYDALEWYASLFSFSDCAADTIRALGTGRDLHYPKHWNWTRGATWNGPYPFHNVANDGTLEDDTIWANIRVHGFYASCTDIPYAEFGGHRVNVMVYASMFRGCKLAWVAESGTNNNLADNCRSLFNSCHHSGISGGSDWFISFTTANTSSTYQNAYNAGYVTGTGTVDYGPTATGSTNPNKFTLSNYNVILSNGPTTRWYSNFTNGGSTLATWQASTHDANSNSTGTTHGFVALGTNNSNDADLHLSAAASSFKDAGGASIPYGVAVDYDGDLRISTHDVGMHDYAAAAPPTPPSLGGRPAGLGAPESGATMGLAAGLGL